MSGTLRLFFLISFISSLVTISSCKKKVSNSGVTQLKELEESPSPSISPTLTTEEQNFIKAFDAHLKDLLRKENIPGMAVAVLHHGKVILEKGYGTKEVGKVKPINEETVFRIGSLSKSVSSLLVAHLIQDGILNWDDKVVDILPGFKLADPDQTKRITISHLLSHSSGLPYHAYTNLIEAGHSMERILPEFKKVKLIGPEGQLCAYQNAAFSLIELILEEKMGSSIQDLYQQYLFTPLDLSNASTDRSSMVASGNYALPHRETSTSSLKTNISSKYYNAIPCGGINASIQDMRKMLYVLTGNDTSYISKSQLQKLFEPYVDTPGTRYFDRWSEEDSDYGRGWRIVQYKDHQLAYHGGYVNRYRSEMAVDLDNELAVCFLFNVNNDYARIAVPHFLDTWDQFLGKHLTTLQ